MTVIIFDTEATGIKNAAIIEAAWAEIVFVNDLQIVSGFCQRYNPGFPIEAGAMAVHHILDEDLADMPPADAFRLPNGLEYMIGHNVDYDWELAGKPDVKRICTLALARHLWPDTSHKLGALLYYLCPDRHVIRDKLQHAHSALVDVELCHILLGFIVEALSPLRSWEELWEHSEAARIPKHITFGKHAGQPISEIPADYKRWLLGQPDVDPYLRKALEAV